MEMNEKIKLLRQKNGLTLEEVGNIVGVGKSTVRKWESGLIANMRRDKIAKLAEALHTTPGYLMGWEDDGDRQNESHDSNSIDPKTIDYAQKLIELGVTDEDFDKMITIFKMFKKEE